MSTSAQVIEGFAVSTGLSPMTLTRIIRALRAEGMVPIGGQGGGKRSAHFGASHLAKVVMALAGGQPSDGPEAVHKLAPLRYYPEDTGNILPTLSRPIRFDKWLAEEITKLATPEGRAKAEAEIQAQTAAMLPGSGINLVLPGPEITMAVSDVGYAWLSRPLKEEPYSRVREIFRAARSSGTSPPRSLRRLTTLKFDLLFVAGELLESSLNRGERLTPNSEDTPERVARSKPVLKNLKSAGTVIHDGLQVATDHVSYASLPLAYDRIASPQAQFSLLACYSQRQCDALIGLIPQFPNGKGIRRNADRQRTANSAYFRTM